MTKIPTAPRREQADTANVEFAVQPGADGLIGISPTDVSQYIRLEQCARYLRLRLYEREAGLDFMRTNGLSPQQLPALLSRSGADFERSIYNALAEGHDVVDFAADRPKKAPPENDRLLAEIDALGRGQTVVVTQPFLAIPINGWRIRGAVDLVRIDRADDGTLSLLIIDIKSSARVKVEFFLQVAFYAEMLDALLRDAGYGTVPIDLGIVYRGPAEGDTRLTDDDKKRLEAHQAAYVDTFGAGPGLLDLVADPQQYRDAVSDLVTGPDANARALATAEFDSLPFHLTGKCDNCIYNEFCLRRSADTDDLSLLPLLTARDKAALQRNTIQTVSDVATLKHQDGARLVADPASIELVRKLSGTWPIGSRLDELVHRARRYRAYKGDDLTYLSYIPDSGYSSLPSSRPDLNPNLVLVYIDVQLDHLQDRVYQVAALVVGHEAGSATPQRRRTVIATTEGPPESLEREGQLFINWIADVLTAVAEVAAPDADGQSKAPIHLIFYDAYTQKILLDGLARHHGQVLATTPLYDFVTQIAAYDSPILTHLESQIRAQKNYPLLAQTLQSVSAWLRFPWKPEIRQTFRHRLFDSLGRMQGTSPTDLEQGDAYYVRRARFTSQVPLEYAYAAWGHLADSPAEGDGFKPYLGATPDLLTAFAAQRLEATEHIAKDLRPNPETSLSAFDIPDLAGFESKAETLAKALEEFVMIERHADMAAWKAATCQRRSGEHSSATP